eukprot:814320-Prorocentrum_minimum.AAC.3
MLAPVRRGDRFGDKDAMHVVTSSPSDADRIVTVRSAKGQGTVAAKGAYELGYGTMHPKYIQACKAKAVKAPQVAAAVKRARSPPVLPPPTIGRNWVQPCVQ